jgi:sugar/nucleoside kinase (ribokinase family)
MKATERQGITAGGTWIVDYTKTVPRYAGEGTCTTVLREKVNNGGAPYNLLVDLRRLQAPFPLRAVGRIGKDLDGASIIKDCRSHAIETSRLLVTPEASTSFSDIMASVETGVRTSFNHAGANAFLSAQDFNLQSDTSRILYFGSLFFLEALDAGHKIHGSQTAALLAEARHAGFLNCVDIERAAHVSTTKYIDGCKAALKFTDLLIINIEIAELLTGLVLRQTTGVDLVATEQAAHDLSSIGKAKCVVIRFPSGALALSENHKPVIEGSVQIPRNRLVNASGAGHAFAAGFLYAYHEEWSLEKALQAAHAVAAACLMDATASAGIRPMEECLSLMEKYGQRSLGSPLARSPIERPTHKVELMA